MREELYEHSQHFGAAPGFTGHEFGWSWGDERRIAWEFECFPLPLGSIGRFK